MNSNLQMTIGFSKSTVKFPILSWLIRLIEGTPYSHVYLTITSGRGVTAVYEASGTQVKFINKEIWDEKAITVDSFTFELTREQKRELVDFCLTYAGIDYGYSQLFGIALARLFKLKRNPLSKGRSSQVCSELITYVLRDILDEKVTFNPDLAGPKDIHNFLKKKDK